MGNNMDFQEESVGITAPLLALLLVNTDPDEFNGLTFGVASSSRLNPEVKTASMNVITWSEGQILCINCLQVEELIDAFLSRLQNWFHLTA